MVVVPNCGGGGAALEFDPPTTGVLVVRLVGAIGDELGSGSLRSL